MPFIGQQPITGAYHKLDSITTSATATYNLQLNGGAYYPTSANHLLVSLNGVMQAPQDSFTVSGSQITFASALTSSDSIDFIMALGDVLDIGVPSDGTVNTSQLANNAVTMDKLATSGTLPALDGSALTGILSVAVIADEKAYNVDGGASIAGFNDRDLNTEIFDPDGIVSISSNQFTLNAGTYIIEFSSPAYQSNRMFTELYDVTNTASVGQGMTRFGISTYSGEVVSTGYVRVTLTASTTYKIRTYTQDNKSNNGLGVAHDVSGNNNIYTQVKIMKLG